MALQQFFLWGVQKYLVLSLFLRTSLLLSFLLSHYSKFLNKTKHTHTHTHTNFFFERVQKYLVLSFLLRTSLLLSFLCPTTRSFLIKRNTHTHTHTRTFFWGGSKVLGVVLPPEDFFAAVFSLSHYSKLLNKTKHTHTHTHTNFFLRGSKVLGVVWASPSSLLPWAETWSSNSLPLWSCTWAVLFWRGCALLWKWTLLAFLKHTISLFSLHDWKSSWADTCQGQIPLWANCILVSTMSSR